VIDVVVIALFWCTLFSRVKIIYQYVSKTCFECGFARQLALGTKEGAAPALRHTQQAAQLLKSLRY